MDKSDENLLKIYVERAMKLPVLQMTQETLPLSAGLKVPENYY